MQISKETVRHLTLKEPDLPPSEIFGLPEKVLQFGTGVLLRALPDFFIDLANKNRIFNGRIVVVKSTASGATDAFERQDGLYTVCTRGIENGKIISENSVNASISRVIRAADEWNKVLECAHSADIELVISNTTEVGLRLSPDNLFGDPPASFPGKLLAFLLERYKAFSGDPDKGLVIVPTELIPENGQLLRSILLELCEQNGIGQDFRTWLVESNHFCSSLVDRIVPGKLNRAEAEKLEKAWGFEDELMIMAEPYRLWAIETSSVRAKRVLGFTEADPGAIIAPDISLFRELKLRLLNGSHTFCCGLAQLAGFTMVREAMADPVFSRFIRSLMDEEIAPAIESPLINLATAHAFASKVADRYTNPFIDHRWSNITLQYSSKMYMRNVPTLNNYIRRFAALPKRMVLGFAAFLVFMNSKQVIDDQAEVFYEAWKEPGTEARVQTILANKGLWNQDLSEIPGLAEKITEYLDLIMQDGMKKTLENFVQQI